MTTGGTESILMAVKAYRDYARDVRGITKPVMVVPTSAHAAFDKAAAYFQIVIRHVPLTDDYTVNIARMKRAIGKNTILVGTVCPVIFLKWVTWGKRSTLALFPIRETENA